MEQGYFTLSDAQDKIIPSPFASKSLYFLLCSIREHWKLTTCLDNSLRSLATSIYYLLNDDRPNGFIHMNKSIVRQSLQLLGVEILTFRFFHPLDISCPASWSGRIYPHHTGKPTNCEEEGDGL